MKKNFKPPIKLFCLAILATVTLLGGVFTVNARAAANPEPKAGVNDNVTVTVPTEIKCALLADGTVVTPSNLSVTNNEDLPLLMDAKTENDYNYPVDYTLNVGDTRVLTRTNQVDTTQPLELAARESKPLQLGIKNLTRDKHAALIDATDTTTGTSMFRIAFNFTTKEKKAFAVYSKPNKSLNFYNRATPLPTVGDYFEGQEVTKVYTDIENTGTSQPWGDCHLNVTAVKVVDPISPSSCMGWFMDFFYVETMDLTKLDTSKVTNMMFMFRNCLALTHLNLSRFNTTNVTIMYGMFFGCSALADLNLSHFNTANVTNMTSMFNACTALPALDLRHFDTSQVTDMSGMFEGCSALTNLNLRYFNTVNVTNMGSMFEGCSALTDLDLSHFDATNVKIMDNMFARCNNLRTIHTPYNIRASKINGITSKSFFDETEHYKEYPAGQFPMGFSVSHTLVHAKPQAFAVFSFDKPSRSYAFNFYKRSTVPVVGEVFDGKTVVAVYTGIETISGNPPWYNNHEIYATASTVTVVDPISPTNCAKWFFGFTYATNMDLAKLDTSKVTDMSDMFAYCDSLPNLDLRHFNTSNVANMSGMFNRCSELTALDLSSFDASNVTDMSNMFANCGKLKTINTPKNIKNPSMTNITTKTFYDETANYAKYTAGTFPTGISDSHTLADTVAFAVYSSTDGSFNFYKRAEVPTQNTDFEGKKVNAVYTNIENINDQPPWTQDSGYTHSVLKVEVVDSISPTNCSGWFNYFNHVKTMNLTNLDTSKVTNMEELFNQCSALTTLDLSHFNTANVTNMAGMFSNCSALTTLDLSHFNTANVTSMASMFSQCSALTNLNLSGFDTSKVTNMNYMFNQCSALPALNLSSFNTANVLNMAYMFNQCSALNVLDLSHFDAAKVKSMNSMFFNCSSLKTLKTPVNIQAHTPMTNILAKTFYDETDHYKVYNNSIPVNFSTSHTLVDTVAFAVYSDASKSLTFYKRSNVPVEGGVMLEGNSLIRVTHVYIGVENTGTNQPWSTVSGNITTIRVVDPIAPLSCANWFKGFNKVSNMDLTSLDTSKVTDMSGMFNQCSALTTLDLSHFNATNVTNMENMFNGCTALETIHTPQHIQSPKMNGITDKTFYDETDNYTAYANGYFPLNITNSHTLVATKPYALTPSESTVSENPVPEVQKEVPVNEVLN